MSFMWCNVSWGGRRLTRESHLHFGAHVPHAGDGVPAAADQHIQGRVQRQRVDAGQVAVVLPDDLWDASQGFGLISRRCSAAAAAVAAAKWCACPGPGLMNAQTCVHSRKEKQKCRCQAAC
jgi:hypothetical protein